MSIRARAAAAQPAPAPVKFCVRLTVRLFRFTTSGVKAQLAFVARSEYEPFASPANE